MTARLGWTMGQVSVETWIQLLLWVAVLLGLVIVATLVVQRFRGGPANEGKTESDLLTKFKEMRHEGDISEAEYRTI